MEQTEVSLSIHLSHHLIRHTIQKDVQLSAFGQVQLVKIDLLINRTVLVAIESYAYYSTCRIKFLVVVVFAVAVRIIAPLLRPVGG